MFGSMYTTPNLAAGEIEHPYPQCPHCGTDWHGLPEPGCPGSDQPIKEAVTT